MMRPTILRPLVALATVLLVVLVVSWRVARSGLEEQANKLVELRGADSPLTLAATGDSLVGRDLPASGADAAFDALVYVLQSSSLAITDLEQTLTDIEKAAARSPGLPHWLTGTARTARDLRRLGFTIITEANDHAADDGGDGIVRTGGLLDRAGLLHAGAGSDLNQARRAVVVGQAPRRVAVVALSTSALPEQRATASRGEIHGRPGVSTLKYTATITADPATYTGLSQVAAASGQTPGVGEALKLSGTVIERGDRTTVRFSADQRDLDGILAEVRLARSAADVVIVSLHSHEPDNRSEAPADFVRRFAEQAIDAGASLVVGHGPRRLRGIELYKQGAILYSLGSFVFDYDAIDADAADVFDTNMSMYEFALAPKDDAPRKLAVLDEPFWWESVVARARFDEKAKLTSIDLTPIDLGQTLPKARRGVPRLAASERGKQILGRLAALSSAFGTSIDIQNGIGVVAVSR